MVINRFRNVRSQLPDQLECSEDLLKLRDSYWRNMAKPDSYQNLTRPYAQKSFTIYSLLLSAKFGHGNTLLPVVPSSTLNSNHEMLQCQLNIALLIWRKKAKITVHDLDVSLHEIEFVEYLQRSGKLDSIDCVLPSLDELYYIVEHKEMLYPFGYINAYEILSIILQQPAPNQQYVDTRIVSIAQLMDLMESTIANNDIDEVSTSTWKYLNAQLRQKQFNINAMDKVDILNMVENCRIMCHSDRSSKLRQTATETISVILINHINELTSDLDLLTNVCGLLLGLLRDDDVVIRNRSSEIIMHLVSGTERIKSHCSKGKRIYSRKSDSQQPSFEISFDDNSAQTT